MQNKPIKITEIFYSLQGESLSSGLPTTFVRLTGCPLRCTYCDTTYSFHGGNNLTIDEILTKVMLNPTKNVCITGGEPLAQPRVKELIDLLINNDFIVSIETSGAIDISEVNSQAIIVMDLKTPGSNEHQKNLFKNIEYLKPNDQVKFVVTSYEDFLWTKNIINEYPALKSINCLISPAFGLVDLKDLAEWVMGSGLNLRMQIQLHKIIWGNEPGR